MCKDGKMCKGCKAKSRADAHARLSAKVSGALKDLSAAEAAVKAGEKKTALAELAKVRKVLEALHARVKPAAGKGTVNSVCPIMGGKFDPNKVKPNLVVAYKDGKVGFCCAGCIPKWNKLSNAQRDQKLAAAARKK
jgi:Tfp pilus assembly protein PilX